MGDATPLDKSGPNSQEASDRKEDDGSSTVQAANDYERTRLANYEHDSHDTNNATATTASSDGEEASGTLPTTFRRTRSLRINTTAYDPSSETSSIVPTSARLSIASTTYPFTHRSLTQSLTADAAADAGNQGSLPTLLDSILQNPGWSVAAQSSSEARRQRRHSLLSMRSLAPTLPPYEESRNHILIPEAGTGPSIFRHQNGNGQQVRGEKSRAQSVRFADEEATSLPDDSHPRPDHESEGEESALIAHYSRVVRTIDSRYTAEVTRLAQDNERAAEEFEREVARMRNEIDATYRGVLRERDKAVERAKEEAASQVQELEGKLRDCEGACEEKIKAMLQESRKREDQFSFANERGIEKARHEVEDVWERRWRDRMALIDEELGRRVKERDAEWLAFLSSENPESYRLAKKVMVASVE